MIKVYIWPFRGSFDAWGHASMHVGSTYISYWPAPTGRVLSKVYRNIYSAHPIGGRTLEDDIDISAEGSDPQRTILINGLDENRIRSWWFAMFPWAAGRHGPPSAPWSSLGWNCSKIVATALKEGGGDKFASRSKSWVFVAWTPNDVRDYAESIVRGMSVQ